MSIETPDSTEELPSRFGKYRLIKSLGKGGQGTVYLAEEIKLKRQVALKLLSPRFASSAEARMRLEREAEAAARINHPSIAKIFEIGEHRNVVYLAMEYIEGRTLSSFIADARATGSISRWIDNGRIDSSMSGTITTTEIDASTPPSQKSSSDRQALSRLIGSFEQACRGLDAAHEKKLIHRDLKPGNIMIRADGSPVLIDFGLAHDAESEGVTLTQTGQMLGTLDYMSPEQIRGERDGLDHRTDIYAMGVTLFECCTLAKPFQAASRHDLMRSITTDAPRRPRSINPRLSVDLEAIILTAIDPDPRRRYQTAAELADDLGRFLRREPIKARPIGTVLAGMRWVRRNALVSATTAIVLFALIGIAVVLFIKNRDVTAALVAQGKERAEKNVVIDENARLADEQRLANARAQADSLAPARPDLVDDLEAWQREYTPLAARLDGYRADLEEIRDRALPYTEQEKADDFATEIGEINDYEVALDRQDARLQSIPDRKRPEGLEQQIEETHERIRQLELQMQSRRSWRFADSADQFTHDLLARLVAGLEIFAHDEAGAMKVVARRIEDCRTIARVSLEEAAEAWSGCRSRIAQSPQYQGLDLKPQLGLIPLGPDPDSGLEEFLHWLTHEGTIPQRDPRTGKIITTDRQGIILVLVPGGSFLMGAQKANENQPNHDPRALPEEGPAHEIKLAPYFLAKHEMTQAQWLHAFAVNPSHLNPGFKPRKVATFPTLRHPVERISWNDCQIILPRIDLLLPTEAEWERAARGGRTDEIYSGTSSLTELNRFANITGDEAKGILGGNMAQGSFRDDFVIHAPVGSLLPNGFGFHDMSGNVWEFCVDGSSDTYGDIPDARGLRAEPKLSANRRIRGGAFLGDAFRARVAFRYYRSPGEAGNAQGVRPARLIKD